MSTAAPLPVHRLLLAGPPEAPGAPELVARAHAAAARVGAELSVLVTGAGLRWLEAEALRRLERTRTQVAVCSRSARDHGLDPTSCPVAWSSLTAWFRDMQAGDVLEAVLP